MAITSPRILQTIKAKLIFIAVLFVAALLAMEIFSTYAQRTLDQASALDTLRGEQVATLTKLDFSQLQLVLAAMDAIVDKDSGIIAPDVMDEIKTSADFINKTMPLLKELVDTDEEKQLVAEIARTYTKMEQAIVVDLARIISERANQEAFAEIDDRIDNLHGQISENLTKTKASVVEEKQEANEQLQATIQSLSPLQEGFHPGDIAYCRGYTFLYNPFHPLSHCSYQRDDQGHCPGGGRFNPKTPGKWG